MINRLRLHNYQAHLDNEIEFNPRITLIRGSNNSNKSAIISALETLLLGSELSVAHDIRWGEESCQISVDIDDSNITRIRTQKDNICRLTTKEGVMSLNTLKESKEYITAISKCGTVVYDKNVGPEAIQFIQIYDSPFHMVRGMSSENRYKRLTQYIDSSKLVAVRGNLRSKLTNSTGKHAELSNRLTELSTTLKDIISGEYLYEHLDTAVKLYQVNLLRKKELTATIAQYDALLATLKKVGDITALDNTLAKYYELLASKKHKENSITYIDTILVNMEERTKLFDELEELESQLQTCSACGQLITS